MEQPTLVTDPHLRLVIQQCADALTSRLLEKLHEEAGRSQKFRGEQEMAAEKARTEVDQARTELAGVKSEIEGLQKQKHDALAEMDALNKQRADLQAGVEKLKAADKRYRDSVEKELKHFAERAG